MNIRLTPKQEAFCREYIIDRNATQAYIRAGYSRNNANAAAARLYANDSIQQRIVELEAPIIEKAGLEVEDVLTHLCYLTTLDITDAIPEDGQQFDLLHLRRLPKEMRQCIRSWKLSASGDLEIKWADPDKAWEILAKHFGLLKEKLEVSGQINYADMARRARMANGEVVSE